MAENISELTNSFLEKYFIPTTEFLLHPKEYKERVKQFISKGILDEDVEEQNQKIIKKYGYLKYGDSPNEFINFSSIYEKFTKEEKYEFYKVCKNENIAKIVMSQYMIDATLNHEYTKELKEIKNKVQLFKKLQTIDKFLSISPYNDIDFKNEVYRGLVRWSFEEEQLDYRYNILVKGFNNYLEPDMMYKLFSPTSSDLIEEYIEEKNKIYENYEKKDLKISAYASVAALMVVSFTNSWKEIPAVVSNSLALVGATTLSGVIGAVAHVGVGAYIFYKTFKLVNEVYHKLWENEKDKLINNHSIDYIKKSNSLENIVKNKNYSKYESILNELLYGQNKRINIDFKTAHYLNLEHREVAKINQINIKEFQNKLKNINLSPKYTLKDLNKRDIEEELLYHYYLQKNKSEFFLIKESLFNQIIKNDYLNMKKQEDKNYVDLTMYLSEKLIQPGLEVEERLIKNMNLNEKEINYLSKLGIEKIMEIAQVKHPQIRIMLAKGEINSNTNFEEAMFYKKLSNYYDLVGIPMIVGQEIFNKEIKNIEDWMKKEMNNLSEETQKMTKAFLVAFTDKQGICNQEVKEYVKNYLADLKELKNNPEMKKAKEKEYIKSLNNEIHKKIIQQQVIEVKNKEIFYFKKIGSFIIGDNNNKLENFNESVKEHMEIMNKQLGYKNGFEYTVGSKLENGVKKVLDTLGTIRDKALGRRDNIPVIAI